MKLEPVQASETIDVQGKEESFLQGVKDCIPTLLGYLSIGFAAGVVEKTVGLSIAEIAMISIILYSRFRPIHRGGNDSRRKHGASIIITILLVNLRHLLLSAALSPYFRHLTPMRNLLIGALLTDETFGVAIQESARKNTSARNGCMDLMSPPT